MTKPDLIIFDLGRVLIDFDFHKVVRNLKRYSPLTKKEIYKFFQKTPLWDTFERGGIEPKDFFQQLSNELHLENRPLKDFTPLRNTIFTEKHDTVSILQRLRGRYRIAALSNVNIMHWDHIVEMHDFMSWFDHPIASCNIGQRKPDLDIFRTTLNMAGAQNPRRPSLSTMSKAMSTGRPIARHSGAPVYQRTPIDQRFKRDIVMMKARTLLFSCLFISPYLLAEAGALEQQAQSAWQERDKPGQTEKAIQLWEQAVTADPTRADLWTALAKAMGRDVRHAKTAKERSEWAERAKDAAAKAIAKDPKEFGCLRRLRRSIRAMGEYA